MTKYLIALWLGLAAAPLIAEPAMNAPQKVTFTVKAGQLDVSPNDFLFKKNPTYIFMLFDIMPYKAVVKAWGGDTVIAEAVRALVEGPGHDKFPKARKYSVIITEVKERDTYNLPRWDLIKVVKRYEAVVDKDGHAKVKDTTQDK